MDSDQTISGDEIFLTYSDDILKSIFIPKDAKATNPSLGTREWFEIVDNDTITQSDTANFINDMTGSSLRGFFVDGSLDSLRLEGMATTLYHLFEDSVYLSNKRFKLLDIESFVPRTKLSLYVKL